MKEGIHPQAPEITISCACGNKILATSTIGKNFSIEICSACHPFFTGNQKLIDTAGRIEKFQKKYSKFEKKPKKH